MLSVRRTRRALDLALALSAVVPHDALPNRGDLERAPHAIERSGLPSGLRRRRRACAA